MTDISLGALAISLLPIAAVAWIAQRWAIAGRDIVSASARMLVQLLGVGFVLGFLLASPNPVIGSVVLLIMIVAAGFIGVRTIRHDRAKALRRALISIGVASSGVLAFIALGVLRIDDPVYQPRVIIPLAGMLASNAMTAITLAAERLNREIDGGQSFSAARREAWSAALIPQVNALLAAGLVSLPGMMTGQILAGVDPLVAVRYQIVVMSMILQSAAFSVAIFLVLSRPAGTKPDAATATRLAAHRTPCIEAVDEEGNGSRQSPETPPS